MMTNLKSYFNIFCMNMMAYVFLYFIFFFLPFQFQKYGLLNNKLNFISLIQDKAKYASSSMTEMNLGLNFIGNAHKLSPFESQIFQSSGLIHLLAISGGQILPVVGLFGFLSSSFIYHFYKIKKPPHKLMIFTSQINIWLGFCLSLFISLLFGGTGALIRVSWLNFFKNINFVPKMTQKIFQFTPNLCEPIMNKFLILFIVSFLFGNIFTNYSFILSAIGACCAELSFQFSYLIYKPMRINFKSKKIYSPSFISHPFFRDLLATIMTCLFVGVILSPLTFNSLINSCLANIFAIPIITFFVTPLALLILIIPIENDFFQLLVYGLDACLMLFKHIALVFSNVNGETNFQTKNTLLFSKEGLIYLNGTLIFLWSFIDLLRSRKFFLFRQNFLKHSV